MIKWILMADKRHSHFKEENMIRKVETFFAMTEILVNLRDTSLYNWHITFYELIKKNVNATGISHVRAQCNKTKTEILV